MEFAFTPDQLALRDGLREALGGADPLGVPVDPALIWNRLTDLGLTEAALPESAGGLGLTPLDLALCLEETGRAALGVPIVETALVAPALLHAGLGCAITAALDGSGLVPWPGFAGAALVGNARAGGPVRLVRAHDFDSDVAAVDPQRPLARIEPEAGEVLACEASALQTAWQAGVLGSAAQLVGLGAAAVEITVAYVKDRQQFGVPVGSFQAVKHQLADAHLAVQLARPLVWTAAWSLSTGSPEAARDLAAAKLRAGDAAALATRAALQCHGAMGYTREYPLHRWLTRIWALRAAWGTPAQHRADLARALGLTKETR